MDYEMMRHINDMAAKREALKPKPVKKKSSKLKKKSSKLIKSLIEIVTTASIAAAMLYAMLAITAWCIS